jgi:hypothetical protein
MSRIEEEEEDDDVDDEDVSAAVGSEPVAARPR